jgi:tetratricopeptide (TPR) repeat protein
MKSCACVLLAALVVLAVNTSTGADTHDGAGSQPPDELVGVTRDELVPSYDAMVAGNYFKALQLLDKLVEKYPDDPNVANQRGRVYSIMGDNLNAIKEADRAIGLQPEFYGWWQTRGFHYLNMGYFELAYADFEEALERNPKDAVTVSRMGECRRWQGRDKEALDLYLQADKLSPKDSAIQSYLGAAQLHLGDYKKARQQGKHIQEIDKSWQSGYLLVGMYQRDQGEYENAIEDFTNELKNLPTSVGAYVARADCYARSGDKKSALKDIETALTIQADYFTEKMWPGWSCYRLAQIYAVRSMAHLDSDKERKQKAEADLERAFKLLTQAVNRSFRGFGLLRHDHDLDALRKDKRWEELMTLVKEVDGAESD